MNRPKYLILFLIGLLQFSILAQEIEFGIVSEEELEEEEHPVYSDADAAVLYKAQNISYGYDEPGGFYKEVSTYIRVKIYSSEGFHFGNDIIGLHDSKGFHDELINLEGVTHNLYGAEITSTKLELDNQFLENLNKQYKLQKLSFPEVREGSIIEYRFTKRTNNTGYIPRIDLQESIPVNKSVFVIAAPAQMAFSVHMTGLIPMQPSFTQYEVSSSTFARGSYSIRMRFADLNGNIRFNLMEITLDSLPAFVQESFVDHAENYRSSVLLELTYFKGNAKQSSSLSWADISEYFYDHPQFGERMRAPLYFRKYARQATKSDVADLDKVKRIYNLVKDRMEWNGIISCYSNSLTKAYDNKTGTSGDINLILCEMLKAVDIEAYPVILSTRNNGVILSPNIIGMNYVIVVAKVNGKNVLLDATYKEGKMDMLPERALNYRGRLVGEEGITEPIDLMPKRVSYEVKNAEITIDSLGMVSAKCNLQSTRYIEARKKQMISFLGATEYSKHLASQFGSDVNWYTNSSQNPKANAFKEEFELTLTNAYDQIGDNYYIDLMLLFGHKEIHFQENERKCPIDFTYPKTENTSLTFTIPEGFEIMQPPESMNYKLPQGEGGYSFDVVHIGDKITIKSSLSYKNSYYEPVAFPYFKEMYQTVLKAESQQLVLKKKNNP